MFSVYTCIGGDSLLGIYSLPRCLTGVAYSFLQNVLPKLLLDVDLHSRIHVQILNADAPPHFLLTAQEFLNNVFPEWWIEHSGPTACPAGSADLNPYIFISGDFQSALFNPMTPNGHYSGHTAPLTSRRFILNIYSRNIRTEYFKHAAQSPFFSLQNVVYFIMLPCLVPVLFTF
jgi:hypothetical protein